MNGFLMFQQDEYSPAVLPALDLFISFAAIYLFPSTGIYSTRISFFNTDFSLPFFLVVGVVVVEALDDYQWLHHFESFQVLLVAQWNQLYNFQSQHLLS